MKKITTSTTPAILLLLRFATASARHDTPTLKGAIQHAQLDGYIARSDDDYWSKFTNAIDVKNSDLTPVQTAATTNDDIIIFEAYARWCGHCQRIAPMYDTTAKHFNEVGGLVLSKGNCDSNGQLCDDLAVLGFPTFYYGTVDDFDNVSDNPLPQLDALRGMSSADEMISFLSERFAIEDGGTRSNNNDDLLPSNNDDNIPTNDVNETTAPPYTITTDAYLIDIEKSTSDSLTQALVSSHLIAQDGARDAFIDWQTWIANSNPSAECRAGAQNILSELHKLWPAENYSPGTVRTNLLTKKQCLHDYSNMKYQGCATGGNTGEYTCGLWQTFHAMSVSTRSSSSSRLTGRQMFRYLEQFIQYYFTCTICQEHFLGMMAAVDPATIDTQDDFAIWLWEAHNEVNERLREEELDDGVFNVDRPKGLFPSPELCTNCLEDREGDYVGPYLGEHTYIGPFLDNFYGDDLVSGLQQRASATVVEANDMELSQVGIGRRKSMFNHLRH